MEESGADKPKGVDKPKGAGKPNGLVSGVTGKSNGFKNRKRPGKQRRSVLIISIMFAVAVLMSGAYASGSFAHGSFAVERSALVLPPPGSGETEFSYGGVDWVILKDNRQASVGSADSVDNANGAGSVDNADIVGSTDGVDSADGVGDTDSSGGADIANEAGSGGSGDMLIITKNVYNEGDSLRWVGGHKSGKYYHLKNIFVFYEESQGMLKHVMDEWYMNFVTGDLKAAACVPVLKYEADAPPPDWSAIWDLEHGLSQPGEPAGRKKAGIVFPLSISEVNRYIYDGEDVESRIATDTDGIARAWWLRSPGVSSGGPVADVRRNGNINSNGATSDARGFRPAMWIYVSP